MKKINVKIKGMHCKSCSMLIEDSLEDIGVKKSTINDKTGVAIIEFDESKVSIEEIKIAIKEEGYKVE